MITRIYIERFGGLADKEIIFSKGLNVIYGKNESGKSTVCAFIRAMLYGVDTQRRRDIRGNMRKRYTPINGGVMSGVLETEQLVIRRSFGATAKADTCNAVNRFTGEVIAPEDIGYAVMGMNEGCFCSTFYLNRADAYPIGEPELVERLAMNVHGEADEAPYDKVCAVLEDTAKPYTKRSGEVDTALEQIRAAQEICREEQKKKDKYDLFSGICRALEQKGVQLKSEIARLEAEKDRANKQNIELQAQQRQLFSEIAQKRSEKSKKDIRLLICAVALGLVGALFLFSYKNPMFMLCACAFVPMVICLREYGRMGRQGNDFSEEDARLAAIERIIEKTANNTSGEAEEKIKALNAQLVECAERIGKTRARMDLLSFDENAQKRLDEANEAYRAAVFERDCIHLAKDVLASVYDELKCDFMPGVNKLFSQYFSDISGGKYGAAADRDMKLSAISASGAILGDYLSSGTLDGANFALRLALCDSIDDENEATLIIDDALLRYDDERAENTLDILKRGARQTLYFTCRKNFSGTNIINI